VTVTENEVKQNEAVIRELEQMKKMVVRGKVQNALLAKANSMLSNESNRVCIEGSLKHHVRKGSTESTSVTNKWVEVLVTEGKIENNDYKAGYVTLIHAESKDHENPNKCEVLNVALEESVKEQVFCFRVSVVGSESELVFACETEDQRQEWVKSISEALTEVGNAPANLEIQVVSFKLEFSKRKMGIRVEENFVEEVEISVQEQEANNMANKGAEQTINDSEKKDSEQEKMQEGSNDDDEEDEYFERPCQLIVTKITDQDLIDGGLVEDCIVTAINDTSLEGMVYSEQIELLRNTRKPFTLTFEIEKYRDNPEKGTGYSSILKELVSDGENSIKKAFYELVKGTPFEKELQSTDDPVTTISALLGNQRRLMALLKNIEVHEVDL